MRSTEVCRAWVVYRMTLPKNVTGGNVVCQQREWETVEANRPGYHTLLYSGIKTEREAELLARGVGSSTAPPVPVKKAEVSPLFTTVIPTQATPKLTRRAPRPSTSPPRRRTGSRVA
jgi:hypothetical protein